MKTQISPLQKSLNIWAITLILWSLYRGFFKTELPVWFDELIAKPLIFLFPIYYFITKKEGKDFLSAIDLKLKKSGRGIAMGFAFGAIFFIVGLLSQIFRSGINISFIINSAQIFTILQVILISLITSFTEETLARGFVLKRLFENSKNMFIAIFFASFLYFFTRIPILFSDPNIKGAQLLQIMTTDILFSFAVSFIYLITRNLWVPIIIHAFYILSIQFFLSTS